MNDESKPRNSLEDRLREATWTPMSEGSRAAHMDAIESALDAGTPTAPPRAYVRRRLAIAAMAAALFVLPTGMAFAAESSVPGDALFPVKKLIETVRSWVDSDVVAEHRVDELAELLSRDAPRADIIDQLDRARVEVDRLATDHALQPVLADLAAAVSDRPVGGGDVIVTDRDREDPVATSTTVISDVTTTSDRPSDRTTTTTATPTDSTVPPDIEGVSVVGVVLAGPTCPVVQSPPDPACADRPVAGAVLAITDVGGKEVRRVESNREGRFMTRLPPGVYVLQPQPVDGLLGTAPPQEFLVESESIELVIGYDTGIR